jgi:hypothetical protein
MVYETELCHYGVKGMKWGVRKARQTTSSHTSDTASSNRETTVRNPVRYDWKNRSGKVKVQSSDHEKRIYAYNDGSASIGDREAKYSTSEFKKKYGMTAREASNKFYKNMDTFVDAVNKKHLSMTKFEAKKATKEGRAEVEKILTDLDDVILNSIGYKDLELGRRMLYEYNMDVKVNDIIW